VKELNNNDDGVEKRGKSWEKGRKAHQKKVDVVKTTGKKSSS